MWYVITCKVMHEPKALGKCKQWAAAHNTQHAPPLSGVGGAVGQIGNQMRGTHRRGRPHLSSIWTY